MIALRNKPIQNSLLQVYSKKNKLNSVQNIFMKKVIL